MEDFGTILWVLIVIGIAASNFVSKARRNRGKGAPHTGEAWPSSEEAPQRDASGTPGIPGIPGIPDIFDTLPGPTAKPAAPRPQRPPQADAGEAAREERTHEGAASVPVSRNRASEAGNPQRNAPQAIPSGQRAKRKNAAPEAGNEAKAHIVASLLAAKQQEAADSPLGEEFDLRRAIIYSEIMKPKFEEPRPHPKEKRKKAGPQGGWDAGT